MILPICVYGDPILRKKCKEIPPSHKNLKELIKNMFDTMYQAKGVGLAAPQVGLNFRIFVVDASPFAKLKEKEDPYLLKFKKVFINPTLLRYFGKRTSFNEGCLSIPELQEEIQRKDAIEIEYLDESFQLHKEIFHGLASRIIQHEYDHIEGKLFIDYLSKESRKEIRKFLGQISKGEIKTDYQINLPLDKK